MIPEQGGGGPEQVVFYISKQSKLGYDKLIIIYSLVLS